MTEEEEIKLIREYVHFSYMLMDATSAVRQLESDKMSSLTQFVGREIGRRIRDRHIAIRKQLSMARIYPRIEDDGGEVVYVAVARSGGHQTRHGIKRKVLNEDVAARLKTFQGEVFRDPNEVVKREVKSGDPYAETYGR